MRVLICEDNIVLALHLEMLLEDNGHVSCGIVDRSDDCMSHALDDPPDVVIVDLDLADGPTGLDLVKALAAEGIASIIVSGQAATVGPGHSAIAVFEKPLDASRFCRWIGELDPYPAKASRGGGRRLARHPSCGTAPEE